MVRTEWWFNSMMYKMTSPFNLPVRGMRVYDDLGGFLYYGGSHVTFLIRKINAEDFCTAQD